jgi:small multidrug resistance pump
MTRPSLSITEQPLALAQDPFRAALYRAILLAAAVYNLAFGLWAGFWPHLFFEWMGMPAPLYPAIWRCLGMVVGLYGLAYAYAALNLRLARPYVAIGLLGKLLGPAGWLLTVASGEWPLRTFTLIVFNDLVWWLPFGLFLLEGTRLGQRLRAAAPFACAGLNALAALVLALVLRPGTAAGGDLASRAAWIGLNLPAWRLGWLLWMAAAVSLLGFYAWWGARLPRPGLARAAVAIALVGLASDLLVESLYVGWLPERLAALDALGTALTGGLANGAYTLAGILLTSAAPWLPRAARAWAWAAWLGGIGLSVSALAGSVPGMVVSSGVLMAFFVPFAAWMGLSVARQPVVTASAVAVTAPASNA